MSFSDVFAFDICSGYINLFVSDSSSFTIVLGRIEMIEVCENLTDEILYPLPGSFSRMKSVLYTCFSKHLTL